MTTATALPTAVPTAQQDRTPAQVLREAADLIEQEGWGQGIYKSSATGCLCAIGAIGAVAGADWADSATWGSAMGRPSTIQALLVLGDALALPPPVTLSREGRISWWNDRPGRTADEVTQAMRDAADLWDAKQAHPAGKKLTPFCGVPTCGCDGTAHA